MPTEPISPRAQIMIDRLPQQEAFDFWLYCTGKEYHWQFGTVAEKEQLTARFETFCAVYGFKLS